MKTSASNLQQSLRSNLIWLSHPWGPSCPAYGGGNRILFTQRSSVETGDTSSSMEFTASNHSGTHIDLPSHFCQGGKNISDFSPDDLIFKNLILVDVDLEVGRRHVNIADFGSEFTLRSADFNIAEALLIRTKSEKLRELDQYWSDGIGIGSGLADWIREKMPNCRAIGIDSISISAFSNRPLGRSVHKEFLCGPLPICLIEDMKLSEIKVPMLDWAIVSPLRIENADAAPVTVIAHQTADRNGF